jgi:hypothetical protein
MIARDIKSKLLQLLLSLFEEPHEITLFHWMLFVVGRGAHFRCGLLLRLLPNPIVEFGFLSISFVANTSMAPVTTSFALVSRHLRPFHH